MSQNIVVTGLTIAALIVTGTPAYAQTTTKDKVERKAEEVGDKTKSMAQDAKAGINDSWLTSKAKIALFADDRVKGRQVNVETRSGVVTLRGKVDSGEAKAAAMEIAKGIEGVKSVRNELQVVAPAQRAMVDADDKQIAKNVEQKFKQDAKLKNAKIDAKVEKGVVILTGEAKSIDISARASEIARNVPGVRYVKNDLTYASPSKAQK